MTSLIDCWYEFITLEQKIKDRDFESGWRERDFEREWRERECVNWKRAKIKHTEW